MKKILTAIIALSLTATVSAKAFDMAAYKAKTGGEIKNAEVKKGPTIAEKILNAELRKAKLEMKLAKLGRMEQKTMDGYTDQLANLVNVEGNTAKAAKAIGASRKAKVAAYAREKAKVRKEINGCGKLIEFWEKTAELAKIERSLRVAGILKSSVSV